MFAELVLVPLRTGNLSLLEWDKRTHQMSQQIKGSLLNTKTALNSSMIINQHF